MLKTLEGHDKPVLIFYMGCAVIITATKYHLKLQT
jgi:hypothetical protein